MGRGKAKGRGPRRGRGSKPPERRALQGPDRRPLGRVPAFALLLAIAVLAAVLRIVPAWDHVYPGAGETRLLGIDSYFHLRHAGFAARHFPHLQRWDIGTQYPRGERTNGAGLFDLAMGSAALVLGGGQASEKSLATVCAWAPIVMSGLVLAALYALARAAVGRRGAVLACALFTLYPGYSLGRTLLGFGDHHAVEILLALLSARGLVQCIARQRGPAPPPWWRPALGHALPLAALLFTWSGAPIYLAVTGATLLLVVSLEIARREDTRATGAASFRYATGLLLWLSAVGLLWRELVMEEAFLPHLLAATALLGLAPPVYLRITELVIRRGVPAPWCAAAGLLLVISGAFGLVQLSPDAARVADQIVGTKTALVDEQQSVGLRTLWNLLGPAGLLALAALPLGLRAAWRRQEARQALLPVFFGALVIALWWRTHDYGYAPPAFIGLMAAFAISELSRLPSFARRPRLSAAAIALLLLLPIWPLRGVERPWRTPEEVARLVELNSGWAQSMRWMKESTPEPSLPIDARVPPWQGAGFAYPSGTYGVLSSWEFGNFVAALGGRPAVHSRGFRWRSFAFFLAADEKRAQEILCSACETGEEVRYVIADARSLGDFFAGKALYAESSLARFSGSAGKVRFGERELSLATLGDAYENSMAARLYLRDGSGLAHYRLVYESPHQSYLTYLASPRESGELEVRRKSFPIDSPAQAELYGRWLRESPVRTPLGVVYQGAITSSVKVFEAVPGARLVGSAPPGAWVEASLRLHSRATDREIVYRQGARAEEDGRFELIVPYATASADLAPFVAARGPYAIRIGTSGAAGSQAYRVEIAAEQVRDGARVELPLPNLARSERREEKTPLTEELGGTSS